MKYRYVKAMNSSILTLLNNALKVARNRPGMVPFLMKTIMYQKQAVDRRLSMRREGTHVPPFIIFSITRLCNLSCAGCYASHFNRGEEELDYRQMDRIVGECGEMGVSFILLAGGEPLARPEILDITGNHPEIIFPVFTNGILLQGEILETVADQKNIIPVLSLEGQAIRTDRRRGRGVYDDVVAAMERLHRKGRFFGTSITITEENFDLVTSEQFVEDLERKGCGLFFYVEYVPVSGDPEMTPLSQDKRGKLSRILEKRKKKRRSLFISFPGDESKFGGCLSSGRGFLHINPAGGIEPCPFSPFSDINLKEVSFREALGSSLLSEIRNAPEALREVEGGCALWNNREWVSSLARAALDSETDCELIEV